MALPILTSSNFGHKLHLPVTFFPFSSTFFYLHPSFFYYSYDNCLMEYNYQHIELRDQSRRRHSILRLKFQGINSRSHYFPLTPRITTHAYTNSNNYLGDPSGERWPWVSLLTLFELLSSNLAFTFLIPKILLLPLWNSKFVNVCKVNRHPCLVLPFLSTSCQDISGGR